MRITLWKKTSREPWRRSHTLQAIGLLVTVVGVATGINRCTKVGIPLQQTVISRESWGNNSPVINGNNNRVVMNGVPLRAGSPTQLSDESMPDVNLRFVSPQFPKLVLANPSEHTASNIKWASALWNLDLKGRVAPLPIPIDTFDWIKPHKTSGPLNVCDRPAITRLLKHGDRVFGSVSVDCPQCARGKTYIVDIIWGEGGWFTEIQHEESGNLFIPAHVSSEGLANFVETWMKQIPIRFRVPIVKGS